MIDIRSLIANTSSLILASVGGFMLSSPEYLAVLCTVVCSLREALRDERLPDINAEDIEFWFHAVRLEDIQAVVPPA